MEVLTDQFVQDLLAGQHALLGKGMTLPYAYRAEQLKKLKGRSYPMKANWRKLWRPISERAGRKATLRKSDLFSRASRTRCVT